MKNVNCNFCGSSAFKVRYQLKDWITHKSGEFTLVECTDCGLLYLNPRPDWDELEPYYPHDYHPYWKTESVNQASIFQRIKGVVWQRRSRAIHKHYKEGRLLDIGCATGDFLVEMERNKKWECYGIEPVAYAAKIAQQNSHAKIFNGELLAAHYQDNFFDVVTVWDVLEHTANPEEVLHEIQRILKPGGLLVIRIPDPTSFTAKLFGPYWTGFDAPRHLFGFPPKLLKSHLKAERFYEIDVIYLSGEHFPFFASFGTFLIEKGHHTLGTIMEKVAYSMFFRIVCTPIFLSLKQVGIGSAPVYFVKKSGE